MNTSTPFRFFWTAFLAYALIGSSLLAKAQPAPRSNTNQTAAQEASAAESALPPDIDPNSPLGQIISLVQAGVEQSVIVNYINHSSGLFNLDSQKIIYLNDLGVPTEIINAMMQHDQRLEESGAVPSPSTQSTQSVQTTEGTQPAEVTVNYFYDTLAPYGAWIDVAGYGWCWRPTVVVYDKGWQPYCNNGHWVYTNHGWFWMSGYSWGWATFHYGRWFHNARYGWCWWPSTTWAPAWVCWRYSGNYCGWAPLPPHTHYRPGIGLMYNGRAVSVGFHFGLGANDFTFVPTRDFHDPHPWRHRVGEKEAARIYHRTRVFHKLNFNNHDRAIENPGIPPHDITRVTKRPIHPVAVRYEAGGALHGKRHEEFEHDGRTLVVHRPHFVGSPVLTPRHITEHRRNEIHSPIRRNENNAFRYSSNPAQNHFQQRNFNTGARRVPQTMHPSRNNGFQPENNHSMYVHPGNAAQNRFQRSEGNRIHNPTVNRAVPQTPRVVTPKPPKQKNIFSTPRENHSFRLDQNRQPYRYYPNHSQPGVLSPRARGFQRQSPQNNFRVPEQHRGSANERHENHFAPPTKHYVPPTRQQEQGFHYTAPRNQSHNNARHFQHIEPQHHAVQPHSTYHPPTSSSHRSNNQRGNNNQRGH